MRISKELKNFIRNHSEEIDNNDWEKIYSSQDWLNLDIENNGKFNAIMYKAGINPLYYIEKIPKYFLKNSNISGDFIIPNDITSIGVHAFSCTELTSITIGKKVTNIGSYAFLRCQRLTSVIIPDSVIDIGEGAFEMCVNLTDITYQGTKYQWNAINKEIFWDTFINDYTIHCTDGDIENEI